jgi:hypothetical protein
MQPIPNFNFVNRREVEFTLEALNRLAQSGDVDPIEQEDFYNFLDAFHYCSMTHTMHLILTLFSSIATFLLAQMTTHNRHSCCCLSDH